MERLAGRQNPEFKAIVVGLVHAADGWRWLADRFAKEYDLLVREKSYSFSVQPVSGQRGDDQIGCATLAWDGILWN
jgi:hypothetical protein